MGDSFIFDLRFDIEAFDPCAALVSDRDFSTTSLSDPQQHQCPFSGQIKSLQLGEPFLTGVRSSFS